MTCPKCEGEIEFEIEPPDYEVGLMGYSAAMLGPRDDDPSWRCHCTDWTDEEITALERQAAEEYTWNPPDPPGL